MKRSKHLKLSAQGDLFGVAQLDNHSDDLAMTQTDNPQESPAPEAVNAAVPASAEFTANYESIMANVQHVLQGKQEVVERALLCLISEGHLLLEDIPGVGKTSLAKALANSISGNFGRIQFTPDVLPSDVLGVNVWDRSANEFSFRPGPVFANLILGDEINRASPKTQAALLEAMEERQVTVDGHTRELGAPFMVIATQNPIEHIGTYPLPESQLDRFFMRVSMGYPDRASGIEILDLHGGESNRLKELNPVVSTEQVLEMARFVKTIHVADSLRAYIVDLAEASRQHPAIALGISPRATLNLQRASRALAATSDRNYVVPDDVKAMVVPVLSHRVMLTPEAQLQGLSGGQVLSEVARSVAVPSGAKA